MENFTMDLSAIWITCSL